MWFLQFSGTFPESACYVLCQDDRHLDALHNDYTLPGSSSSHHQWGVWATRADGSYQGQACQQDGGWGDPSNKQWHKAQAAKVVRSPCLARGFPLLYTHFLGRWPYQIFLLWLSSRSWYVWLPCLWYQLIEVLSASALIYMSLTNWWLLHYYCTVTIISYWCTNNNASPSNILCCILICVILTMSFWSRIKDKIKTKPTTIFSCSIT